MSYLKESVDWELAHFRMTHAGAILVCWTYWNSFFFFYVNVFLLYVNEWLNSCWVLYICEAPYFVNGKKRFSLSFTDGFLFFILKYSTEITVVHVKDRFRIFWLYGKLNEHHLINKSEGRNGIVFPFHQHLFESCSWARYCLLLQECYSGSDNCQIPLILQKTGTNLLK